MKGSMKLEIMSLRVIGITDYRNIKKSKSFGNQDDSGRGGIKEKSG